MPPRLKVCRAFEIIFAARPVSSLRRRGLHLSYSPEAGAFFQIRGFLGRERERECAFYSLYGGNI
jgi:hypothetical protein